MDALRNLVAEQKAGKIKYLALTNFDTDHIQSIVDAGIPIVSNQVQFSLLDRRPLNKMVAFCAKSGVKLLCYGVVAGGLISEKYVGQPEPSGAQLNTVSLKKYFNVMRQFGGWKLFQELLAVLKSIAAKHSVSIANVASRWVLDCPQVAGVILGTRLGIAEHIADNLRVFSLKLDDSDRAQIDVVLKKAKLPPGDCGDEYR